MSTGPKLRSCHRIPCLTKYTTVAVDVVANISPSTRRRPSPYQTILLEGEPTPLAAPAAPCGELFWKHPPHPGHNVHSTICQQPKESEVFNYAGAAAKQRDWPAGIHHSLPTRRMPIVHFRHRNYGSDSESFNKGGTVDSLGIYKVPSPLLDISARKVWYATFEAQAKFTIPVKART